MKTLKTIFAFLLCFALFSFSGTPNGPAPKTKSTCAAGVKAQLCSDCGFGNKKDNCAKCNKWIGSTKVKAYLCNPFTTFAAIVFFVSKSAVVA